MAFKNHFSPIAPQTIFKEARISNNFKDINIKLNNKIESVNSLILSNALTWLKFTLEDLKHSDKDVVIAAPFEDFSTNCLKSMLDLIHFGYVFCINQFEYEHLKNLCQSLGMSVSCEENNTSNDDFTVNQQISKSVQDLMEDEDTINENYANSSSENENTITNITKENVMDSSNSKNVLNDKKKSKRIFVSNLTAEDLTCNVCTRRFSAMYKLRIHSLIHSATPPFVCSFCGRGFNNKYKMRGHEKKRHCGNYKVSWPETEGLDKRITCEKCGAVFDTKKARREHIQAAHPLYHASSHSCPLCQKVFKGLKGLNTHISNASCQKNKRNSYLNTDPNNANDGSKTFKCQKCPQICSSRKSLKIHGRTVHLEGGEHGLPFKCGTCSRAFLKQSYLEEHQNRFHLTIKPYPCMFCPKRCATKQDLDRHLLSHSGEARFQCQFCDRAFCHRASLKKHQRGHLGERPYMCKPCNKSFGLLTVLQKHNKSHLRKGDKTQVVSAPKGHRGYSHIEYVDKPLEMQTISSMTNLDHMQVEYEAPSTLTGSTVSHKNVLATSGVYGPSQSNTDVVGPSDVPYQEPNYEYQVLGDNSSQPNNVANTDCEDGQKFGDFTETEYILGLLGDQHHQQGILHRENPVDKL